MSDRPPESGPSLPYPTENGHSIDTPTPTADPSGSQTPPPHTASEGQPPPPRSHGRLRIAPSARPRDLTEDPRIAGAWQARVVTLFPEAFPGALGLSLTGKALADGLWQLSTIDLRRHGLGRHRQVDDTPAGGGAGMVLRPDIVASAMAEAGAGTPSDRGRWPVVYLSPRGKPFDQAMARRWSGTEGMTLLCGRFEGVDERAIEACRMEEVSIGDYVLTGGEIAAQVLIDATVRLIPRVVGNTESVEEDSFSAFLLEYPQYTKPSLWDGRPIPDILLSGHHAKIADWRRDEAERLTKERRPDLWRAYRAWRGMDPDGDQEL